MSRIINCIDEVRFKRTQEYVIVNINTVMLAFLEIIRGRLLILSHKLPVASRFLVEV